MLILVDGHPINEVLTGQGFVGRGFDVDLGNVERIEMARGPGSVLYGTGALFGVVNVVTRRPAPGVHASAGVQGGTLGLAQGRVTASARGDAGEMMASAAGMEQVGDRRFAWERTPPAPARRWPSTPTGSRLVTPTCAPGWARSPCRPGTTNAASACPPAPSTPARTAARSTGTCARSSSCGRSRTGASCSCGPGRPSTRAASRGRYRLRPDASGQPRPDLGDRFLARWLTGELRLETPLAWRQRLTVGGELQ